MTIQYTVRYYRIALTGLARKKLTKFSLWWGSGVAQIRGKSMNMAIVQKSGTPKGEHIMELSRRDFLKVSGAKSFTRK